MTDPIEPAGAEIIDTPNPQTISFTPDEPEVNPVEAAMAEMEKEGHKFGDDDEAPKEEEKAKPEKAAKPKAEERPEAKAEKTAQERGEKGQFKAKEPEIAAEDGADDEGEGGGEEDEAADDGRRSERDIDKPPSRFLPRAKEKWASVDEDVRGEVHRAFAEMEHGLEISREDREFRKSLRQFEDMATQAGTTVPAAIANYVRIDQELRTNPERALAEILKTINLTPQQYAQHVLGQEQMRAKNPQAYAQNQQTQQLQGQIQALQQQIQQLTQGSIQDREAARVASIERDVIAPFRAEHPRYDELQGDIAFFLNSDKIPSTLNERQRLEAAYDMAVRINPDPAYGNERLNPAQNRPLNPAGKKSIKGAPGHGSRAAPAANINGKEAIDAAMRQMGL